MVINDLVLMSLVIFVPTLFALALLFFPKGSEEGMRWCTLFGTAVTLVFSIFLFIDFLALNDQYALTGHVDETMLGARTDNATLAASKHEPALSRDLVGRVSWLKAPFKIDYFLGVDGISMALVLLTTLLSFLAMLASWNISKSVKGYCMLFLVLETGMLGTFMALDLFLFYVFWEVMLLPMYFLIGIWGGPRKEYAAIKFFLYTLLGSVLMLIAILAFYFKDLTKIETKAQRLAEWKEQDWTDAKGRQDPKSSIEQKEKAKTTAERERGALAAVAKETRETTQTASVNSFDILVLHKVARIEEAYEQMAAARLKKAEGRLRGAREDLADAEEALKAQKLKDVKAREDELAAAKRDHEESKDRLFSTRFQITMFVLLFIGFAIKVPMFPFHTWLPDAHVEAPTPISMILAGVLLKMGGYGILRIAYPICPTAAYELAWYVGLLGVISIVYGAFAAMAQTDFKRLVAYSSVSHMGYVILGIAVWSSMDRYQYWAWGMNGAMYQMLAHGITSAGMFFMVGVIYDRAHHRDLNRFGGLNNAMPLYSGMSAIIFFGAMGLPGLCGFPGEFFTILGTWNFSILFAVLAAGTVILTAGYILWTIQRVYLGENKAYHGYLEISPREILIAVPLLVLTVLMGVWPRLILDWMQPSVIGLVQDLAGMFK